MGLKEPGFRADLSRELICINLRREKVRFDPTTAELIFKHFQTGLDGRLRECYYFVAPNGVNFILEFPQRSKFFFWGSAGLPCVRVTTLPGMIATLILNGCSDEIIERYFRPQSRKTG